MKFRLLLILVLFLLVSCYVPSYKVYNLSVKHDDAIWLNGKELVKLAENNVEVIVNFDHVEHGIVSFDLSIANYTDEAILIIPEKFYCSVTSHRDARPSVSTEEEIIYALNPEAMILNYDKQIERNYAQTKSDNRTELLFALFDLAEDIHNKDKKDEEIEQQKIEREEREEMYDKSEKKYITNMNQLKNERNLMQNQALRKTTLLPDHKISGKLYFQIPHSTLALQLVLPIEDRNLKLEYEKIK
jgi:hypothetical protein